MKTGQTNSISCFKNQGRIQFVSTGDKWEVTGVGFPDTLP